MICNIKDLRFHDNSRFGIKASSLGELLHHNITVPNGFALSTDVYEEFLQYNSFPFSNTDYLIHNDDIAAFLLNSFFSDETTVLLKKNYDTIVNHRQNVKFAVRSSAICEDTKFFSMAGMFHSYTNLVSFKDVVEAIKKCYASLFQDKVLSFMINNKIPMDELKMGVIIQEFVEGELSGVIFSADILEMNPDVICINIADGLCEKYVGGKVTSSLYKISKMTGKQISCVVTNESPKPSDIILSALFNMTLEVEKVFGSFQDIEWILQGNDFYLLQSRPITTFKDKKFDLDWNKAEDSEYAWWLGPPFPFPPLVLDICPVEEAAFSQGAYNTGYAERNMARVVQNGYIYFRNKSLPHAKEKRDAFLEKNDQLFEQGLNIFQDILQPKLDELILMLNQFLLRDLSSEELINYLDLSLEYLKLSTCFHWPAEAGTRYTQIFKKDCDDILGELSQKDYYDLIYEKSIITKEREMLFEMADIVKSDPSLIKLFTFCLFDEILIQKLKNYINGHKLLDKIKDYLHAFGICCSDHDDYIRPTLLERPDGVIRKVRSLLGIGSNSFYNSIASIYENQKRILNEISKKLTEEQYKSFQKKLAVAQKAFLVTDTHNYYIERQSWGYLRLAVMKAAKALRSANIISNIDNVFYLTFQELKASLSGETIDPSLIRERKHVFEKQKSLLPPQHIGKVYDNHLAAKENSNMKDTSSNKEVELYGIATFNGIIRGKIMKGIPQSINDDCILVVYHGHSSDITHLLSRVKGLIFEDGSPFDHLGIITREMNIPAIYYVNKVLSILENGDLVEIDGRKGVIKLM